MNFLRKYNVTLDLSTAGSLRIRIPIRKAGSNDFAVGADWTPAAGDVKLSKNGAAQANIGTLPTYSEGSWEFTLTGTELSARLVEVRIVDSATKAVDDEGFNVETFGHASAMFADNYITAINNLSTAQVNAEVVDALATDTYAEPTTVPAATSSLSDKIAYLFTRLRNKREQTSSAETIYQDDGSTVLATASKADDNTTFTKGEDTTA